MPSISQSQQNYMQLVNAYKNKALKKSDVTPSVVATAKSMTQKQIDDMLKVKKNAPEKAPMARADGSIEISDISIEDLMGFLAYLESMDKGEMASMPYMPRSKQYLRLN
jgi:hypothetical protein